MFVETVAVEALDSPPAARAGALGAPRGPKAPPAVRLGWLATGSALIAAAGSGALLGAAPRTGGAHDVMVVAGMGMAAAAASLVVVAVTRDATRGWASAVLRGKRVINVLAILALTPVLGLVAMVALVFAAPTAFIAFALVLAWSPTRRPALLRPSRRRGLVRASFGASPG